MANEYAEGKLKNDEAFLRFCIGKVMQERHHKWGMWGIEHLKLMWALGFASHLLVTIISLHFLAPSLMYTNFPGGWLLLP